jgi:type IV secretion system protein VirD4
LQAWANPRIAAATSMSDFDLRDLRRRPMSIYVRVQPGNIERMRPFLRLFFNQLLTLNTDRTPTQDPSLNVPVLLMLDEFARLGHMKALAEAAQFIRGYGLRLALVVQNKAQLRAIYGKDGAADIFDNLGAEVVYGTTDLELAQELEKRLGDDTINVTTLNRPRFWSWMKWDKQSAAEHPHRRPLMLAQELGRLPDNEQNPEDAMVHRPELHVTYAPSTGCPAARCADRARRRQHADSAEARQGHERAGRSGRRAGGVSA